MHNKDQWWILQVHRGQPDYRLLSPKQDSASALPKITLNFIETILKFGQRSFCPTHIFSNPCIFLKEFTAGNVKSLQQRVAKIGVRKSEYRFML